MTYYSGASLKGRLFVDGDGDNTEWNSETNVWEAGFAGVPVSLVNAHGAVVATVHTNQHGWYEFTGVWPGDYRVQFPEIDGYEYAKKDVGHYGSDSDANSNGLTDPIKINWGDRICEVDAGLQPVQPVDDCVVTETLLHENFNAVSDPDDSAFIKSDGGWQVRHGQLYTDGCNDGYLTFEKVQLDGHSSSLLTFDIKTPNTHPFEADDRFEVQISIDGGAFVTLDSFVVDHHRGVFVGSASGQTFGESFTTLSYLSENLPAGAGSIQLRFLNHSSWSDEIFKIDNVKLTADKKICEDCPEDATKVDFNDLTKGTIVSEQYEGVTISAFANGAGNKIVVEAEHMGEWGFRSTDGANASGGKFEKLSGHDGKLYANFDGPTGEYDVTIRAQDENDGQSELYLVVGDDVRKIVLDRDTDGVGSDHAGFSDFTIKDVHIARGQHYYVYAKRDGDEFVRIDKLTFESVAPTENRAMIFDTDHITGGDHDLANGDRKVLIISEDGDSSDPDDNAQGGQFHLDFDVPSDVASFKLIDSEEGGTVIAYDADGVQIGDVIQLPKLADGSVATVTVDREGVSKLVITLNGSGAIDDLCFKGDEQPAPGSLSGRYFCDSNDNDLDDGDAVDPAVAGVQVELLDAAGNGTGIITTTAADGTYSFTGLRPGSYGVKFTDPNGVLAGKVLVTPNVGDDATDSDAIGDTTLSTITGIEVVTGEDTPDNDAGAEYLPGSLSGRYFCDSNDNDLDDGDAVDPAVAGVQVELLDAAGNGTGIITTTAADGTYSFTGLRPGSYGVKFTDPNGVLAGKVLVTPNVGDDATDSDAIGDTTLSTITGIEVVTGEDTPDNDAGAEQPNTPPTADDEMAKLCANTLLSIDVLDGDQDMDGDDLSITAVNGEAIVEGGSVTLDSGAVVRLENGRLVYDLTGTDDFDQLPVGTQDSDSFVYTVSDDELTAEGAVNVTVCGDFNTLETIEAALGQVGLVHALVFEDTSVGGSIYDLAITSVEFPDSQLGEVLANLPLIDQAYCLSVATSIDFAPTVTEFTVSLLDADSYLSATVGTTPFPTSDGGFNPQNVDNVNWLLNEAEALLAEGFTQGNIQRAIWNLLDGGPDSVLNGSVANNGFNANPEFSSFADAFELTERALANDGFVAGEGDMVGLLLDPVESGVQPFVIAVEFDALTADCLCENMFI
ncbi:SdrD B-like domain-containing protein [Rubrimonas cliftonensis]|uniref:Cna protein B-type domain-containing protein n=1 Tax=Rubrimonas cliftonensis TaxID=89524 RepID=A0A1H3X964_9RHOB|nr:SdrD B-like domain-containing protein [Rubrimonas cliftonensis]SDZ95172.1 Cna protein B-type domain-containing protein [Rubrimonas cliftonensis]